MDVDLITKKIESESVEAMDCTTSAPTLDKSPAKPSSTLPTNPSNKSIPVKLAPIFHRYFKPQMNRQDFKTPRTHRLKKKNNLETISNPIIKYFLPETAHSTTVKGKNPKSG